MKSFLLIGITVILTAAMLFALLRTIKGPTRSDRLLGINMIGSLGTALFAVLAVYLEEHWLLDVCIIYCLISFLAVVVLSRIHLEQAGESEVQR